MELGLSGRLELVLYVCLLSSRGIYDINEMESPYIKATTDIIDYNVVNQFIIITAPANDIYLSEN